MIVKKIRFLNNNAADIVTFEVELFDNALNDKELYMYIQLGDEKMLYPAFLKKSINSSIVGESNYYYYTVSIQEYSNDIMNTIRRSNDPERFSSIKIKYYIADSVNENIIEKGIFVDTDGLLSREDSIQGLEENASLLRELQERFVILPCYDNQFSKFTNISQINQINSIKIRFNNSENIHVLTSFEFSFLNNFLFTNKLFEFLNNVGNNESVINTYKSRIVSIIDNSEVISPDSTNYISFKNLLLVKEELDKLIFNDNFQYVDIEIYVGEFSQFLSKRFTNIEFSGLNSIRAFLLDLLEESRIQSILQNITSYYDNDRLVINFSQELSDFYSDSYIQSINVYNNLTSPVLQKDITREKFYYFNEELETNELVNFSLFNLARLSANNEIFLPTLSSNLEDVVFANLNQINKSYNNFYQDCYFLEINLTINNAEYSLVTKLETINVQKTNMQRIINSTIALTFFNYYNNLNNVLTVEGNQIKINFSNQNSVLLNNIFSYLGYSTIITDDLIYTFLSRLYLNYITLDDKGNIKRKLNFTTSDWVQLSDGKIFITTIQDIDVFDEDIVLCRAYALKNETHSLNTSSSFRRELIDTFSNNSITELIEIADGLFAIEEDYEIYIENLFRIIDKVIV